MDGSNSDTSTEMIVITINISTNVKPDRLCVTEILS
jgi:hypothetical protein